MPNKKFKTAYVVQASGYNFGSLLEECENIVFITTGYESDADLAAIIANTLKEYNPKQDVLVPVGNVATNIIVGIIAEQVRAAKKAKDICVAFYREKEYILHNVEEMQWQK